ncbi:MAG: prepilin peptidase [Lachnospiraceae bacterium]|nr:prepilin peptidase [Lachnospiraceae bacterium]
MGVLCLFLSVACVYDYRERRIPNLVPALIAIYEMLVLYFGYGERAIIQYLAFGVIILVVGYLLYCLGGLGAGDVKLLAVIVGCLPIEKVFCFIFYSMLIAAIVSLIQMLRKRNRTEKIKICLSGPILISWLLYMGGFY